MEKDVEIEAGRERRANEGAFFSLFFLFTLRISWVVACAFKASFDSFDLNGGFFTEVLRIGRRSEEPSPPLRCNTGVLSGTQECKTQKNLIIIIFFFSD